MKLYNSLSRKTETLQPLNQPEVSIYTCGPTVYDYPHIGNWSGYIYWDVLVRALELDNLQPKRVVNITDVGHLVSDADDGQDKMTKAAERERKTAWQIAEFYTKYFVDNWRRLNLREPLEFAKATDFINQQLEIVRQLKDKGLTYQISDGIYMDTAKVENYGELSGQDLEQLQAGARVEFNPEKRQTTDFALWKFSGQNEQRDMEWETPSDILAEPEAKPRMGFPGWHLECVAIIWSTLGQSIDIHGGGIDHIPIHHTNEIAESEAITNQPLAQIWIHNNHLKSDGRKISKSLGNGYRLEQLEEKGFSLDDFKMFVLQSHYQTEGNFSFENLTAAKNRLSNWRQAACLRHQLYSEQGEKSPNAVNFLAAQRHLIETINDNLNTPQALSVIDQEFDRLNSSLDLVINRQSLRDFLQLIDDLLGINLLAATPDIDDQTKQLIQQRQIARDNRDFKQADKLRDELLKKGIGLNDSAQKSFWYYV